MDVRLNETIRPFFSVANGEFDLAPTCVVYRNGSLVMSASVTVTAITSRTYQIAYTLGDGWAAGDEGTLFATGLSGGETVELGQSFRVREATVTSAQVEGALEPIAKETTLSTGVTTLLGAIGGLNAGLTEEQADQLEFVYERFQGVPDDAVAVVVPASLVPDTCTVYIDLMDADWDAVDVEGQLFEAWIPNDEQPVLCGDTYIPVGARFTAFTGAANAERPGLAVLTVPQSAAMSRNGVPGVQVAFRCSAGRLKKHILRTVPSEAGPVNIKDLLTN